MNKILVLLFPLFAVASPAWAFDLCVPGEKLLFQTSVWSKHHKPSEEHNNGQELINLECHAPSTWRFNWQQDSKIANMAPWVRDVNWLAGGASFLNSFYQRSTYLYVGGRYDVTDIGEAKLYAKLTAGLLHGYKDDTKDKIPFNHYGIAPVALPAFGIQFQRVGVEVIPFGTAGVMVTVGVYLF
jgi:hypothetical protein